MKKGLLCAITSISLSLTMPFTPVIAQENEQGVSNLKIKEIEYKNAPNIDLETTYNKSTKKVVAKIKLENSSDLKMMQTDFIYDKQNLKLDDNGVKLSDSSNWTYKENENGKIRFIYTKSSNTKTNDSTVATITFNNDGNTESTTLSLKDTTMVGESDHDIPVSRSEDVNKEVMFVDYIDKIDLTGNVTTPVKGETDQTNISTSTEGIKVTQTWSPSLKDHKFEADTEYTSTIKISVDEDYRLKDQLPIHFNDPKYNFVKTNDGYVATYKYPKTDIHSVTNVDVNWKNETPTFIYGGTVDKNDIDVKVTYDDGKEEMIHSDHFDVQYPHGTSFIKGDSSVVVVYNNQEYKLTFNTVDGIALTKDLYNINETTFNYTGSNLIDKIKNQVTKPDTNEAGASTITIKKNNNTVQDVIDAGTYDIVVSAQGGIKYNTVSDLKIGSIEVLPKDVKDADFVLEANEFVYSGKEQKPTLTTTLKDKDYKISYLDNVNAGTASINIEGKGNYKGSITKRFEIKPYELQANDLVCGDVSKVYDGTTSSSITSVNVRDGLSNKPSKIVGTSHFNSANVGDVQWTFIPNAITSGNYTISNKVQFIKPTKITPVEVKEVVAKDFDFIAGSSNFEKVKAKGINEELIDGKVTYRLNDDTKDLSFDECLNAMNALELSNGKTCKIHYTFKGTGNYTGEVSGTMTGTARTLQFENLNNALKINDAITYGQTVKEFATISESLEAVVNGGSIENQTYKLTIDEDSILDAGKHSLNIFMSGTMVVNGVSVELKDVKVLENDQTFTIQPKELTSNDLEELPVLEVVYDGTDHSTNQEVAIKKEALVGNDEVNVSGTMQFTDVNAGTNKEVKFIGNKLIQANNNYTMNGITKTSNNGVIEPKSISKDDFLVETNSQDYTGSEIKPSVTSKSLDQEMYEVSYSDNINAGNAKITITGKGNYCGTIEYQFEINKIHLTVDNLQFLEGTSFEKTYDGTATSDIEKIVVKDTVAKGTEISGHCVFDTSDVNATKVIFTPNSYDDGNVVLDDNQVIEHEAKINPYQLTIENDLTNKQQSVKIHEANVVGCVIKGVNNEEVSGTYKYSFKDNTYSTVKDLNDAINKDQSLKKNDVIDIAYTFDANGNYAGTVKGNIKVTLLDIRFDVKDDKVLTIKDGTYGMKVKDIVSINDVKAMIGTQNIPGTFKLTVDENMIPDVGEYNVNVVFTSNDGKYENVSVLEKELTYSVKAKKLNASDFDTNVSLVKTYDGTTTCELKTLNVKKESLVGNDLDTDFTVEGSASYVNSNASDHSKIVFTTSGKLVPNTMNYVVEKDIKVELVGKIEPVTMNKESFNVDLSDVVYTGKEFKPEVTSKLDETEYVVSYKNNIDAGSAKVMIDGRNNHKGHYEYAFKILKAEQNDFMFEKTTIKKPIKTTYKYEPINGFGTITYSSKSDAVKIDETGMITVLKVTDEPILIQAIASGDKNHVEGSTEYTLEPYEIHATSVTAKFEDSKDTFELEETPVVIRTIEPSNTTDDIEWTVTNGSIDENGKIHFDHRGVAELVGYNKTLDQEVCKLSCNVYKLAINSGYKMHRSHFGLMFRSAMFDRELNVDEVTKHTMEVVKEAAKAGNNIDVVLNMNEHKIETITTDELKELKKNITLENTGVVRIESIVKANDLPIGKINEMIEPVHLSLPIPKTISQLENGYSRTYEVYSIHDGVVTKVNNVVEKDGAIEIDTPNLTTFVIKANDVKKQDNKPSDNGNTPVVEESKGKNTSTVVVNPSETKQVEETKQQPVKVKYTTKPSKVKKDKKKPNDKVTDQSKVTDDVKKEDEKPNTEVKQTEDVEVVENNDNIEETTSDKSVMKWVLVSVVVVGAIVIFTKMKKSDRK